MRDRPMLDKISVSNLSFRYGDSGFCLQIPSFVAAPGEKVAIVGASGSGKTTLLHLLAGIRTPSSGEIQFGDLRVDRLSDAERRQFRIANIGFIFQNFELIEYLDVLDNILHSYRLNPALKLENDVRQRAIALAADVGIKDKLKRSVGALSQGEQQRVAICRALLPQPHLLLADEATGNLDPANKQRILDILSRYVDERSAILIAVTHDRELLDRFDRVVDFQTFAIADNNQEKVP